MPTKTGGPPLSVTIVAQNEERTIAAVLAAVSEIADEIVFLDSGSTDRTVEIAKSFGVRFYHQDWLGYAEQKNKAIDLATGEWILSLDADEVLTPALVAEIRDLMKRGVPDEIAGFKIPRVLYIGDSPVKGGGFYPDAQLRLIRKGKGRFQPRVVHESIKVEGHVRQLKNDMLHYAYNDVEQFAADHGPLRAPQRSPLLRARKHRMAPKPAERNPQSALDLLLPASCARRLSARRAVLAAERDLRRLCAQEGYSTCGNW